MTLEEACIRALKVLPFYARCLQKGNDLGIEALKKEALKYADATELEESVSVVLRKMAL